MGLLWTTIKDKRSHKVLGAIFQGDKGDGGSQVNGQEIRPHLGSPTEEKEGEEQQGCREPPGAELPGPGPPCHLERRKKERSKT